MFFYRVYELLPVFSQCSGLDLARHSFLLYMYIQTENSF